MVNDQDEKPRLVTYTTRQHTNGFWLGTDNHLKGATVGAGYASEEEAVKAWKPFDDQRTMGLAHHRMR